MNSNSILYAVSGVSGSGKTTTMREVMTNEVLSFTTRMPRKGEVDGVDYIFSTLDEINHLDSIGRLIERVEYSGNHYGITKDELESKLRVGDAFVVVDYHGYQQLRKLYDKVVGIYIKIDKEDAIRRMLQRGDTKESIKTRIDSMESEMKNQIHYDYIIENKFGQQLDTVEKIKSIIAKRGMI